jgi:4-alpha-glucanotransferase/alpha-amylase
LRKTWQLTANGLAVVYTGELPAGLQLETELNLALPSCDGYGGRYVEPDGHFPGGFGAALDYVEMRELALEDAALAGRLALSCAASVAARMAPHYTVSQSEAGFEKIMQAACIRLRWQAGEQRIDLQLSPCASWL